MEFFTVHLTKSFRLIGLALLGLVALNQADAAKKPNILWIVGENFSLDLACYGQKNVSTPNLDRLAREGTRYTRVYSTSPVCAPSRSALMTGWYATTTDMHHMRSHRTDGFRLPAGVRPITHLLRDAGYHTANITHIGERVVGTGKLDLNFAKEGPVYAGRDWADLKKKQPFFAQINMPEAEYDIMTASPPRNLASNGLAKNGIPRWPRRRTSRRRRIIPTTKSRAKNGRATSTPSPAPMCASAGFWSS